MNISDLHENIEEDYCISSFFPVELQYNLQPLIEHRIKLVLKQTAIFHTILDNTKNQCKMTYFDESTLDKRVNIGHFDNNLFQIFRLQCCSQLRTILEQSHQFDNCFFSKLSIISTTFHLFQFSN